MTWIASSAIGLSIIGGVLYGVALFMAYINGSFDGELDEKYKRAERENDHYNGIRRAIYEVAYQRGVEKSRRVIARRKAINEESN